MARRLTFSFLLLGALALCITGVATGHDRDRDVVSIYQLRGASGQPVFPSGENVPLFPPFPQDQPPPRTRPRAEKLQEESKLELIRYVWGEFAKAVKAIPGGKKGFRYSPDQPLDKQALMNATASAVPAASPGDTVQITKLEFKGSELRVEINGGGKKKKSWRERIQISGGGGIPTVNSTSTNPNAPSGPPGFLGIGSTLILDYGKDIPDLTVDELKEDLGVFLDFEGFRSAAVQWIDTLPPEYQEAIQDHRAVVGMDREMVIASMGKPEKKVREKDLDGLETEDWIYGHPPAKTVFVKFAGDKVISVKEFPN